MSTAVSTQKQKRPKTTPRPGSLADRLITRHGKLLGEVLYHSVVGFMVLTMLVYLVAVFGCALIVINSAYHVSALLNTLTVVVVLFGFFIYVLILRKTDESDFSTFLKRYFRLQVAIAVMAFVQTFFWMIDSENTIHEPRSVFLLSISAFLAYFRDQFSHRVERLLSLSHHLENPSTD